MRKWHSQLLVVCLISNGPILRRATTPSIAAGDLWVEGLSDARSASIGGLGVGRQAIAQTSKDKMIYNYECQHALFATRLLWLRHQQSCILHSAHRLYQKCPSTQRNVRSHVWRHLGTCTCTGCCAIRHVVHWCLCRISCATLWRRSWLRVNQWLWLGSQRNTVS